MPVRNTLLKQNHQQSVQHKAVLAGILVFIVLYPLTSCASLVHAGNTTSQKATLSWKLIWSDEFNGAAGAPPDRSKWSANIGGYGWGDKQLEYNTDNQNAYLDGQGNLVLEARKSNPQGYHCWYGSCKYTSARISTLSHFSFSYGLVEASIKIPAGRGLWPAFWMMGDDFPAVGWPACGEVDIMENIGRQPGIAHASVHGPGYFTTGFYKLLRGNLSDGFHLYALAWDPNFLHFMIDGVVYFTVSKASVGEKWVFDRPFFILLNNAVGGAWPGNPDSTTVFPQKMLISYVRVYQYK